MFNNDQLTFYQKYILPNWTQYPKSSRDHYSQDSRLPLSKASKYLLWLSLAYSSCPGLPISILFAVCSAQVPMCHPEYLCSKTHRFYANSNTTVSLDLIILRVCQSIVVTCILHGLSSVDHSASLEVKRTVGQ